MPSDAYPPHLGWAPPGAKLLFRREMEAEGRWPPSLAERHPRRRDPERPPATPFLVVPESDADYGTGPRARWATSPSIFLLSSGGTLATVPREGETYRVAALVRNVGPVPSLMAFAEFLVAGFRPDAAERAVPLDLLNPDFFADAVDLGVTAFSVGQETATWVVSRRSWTCAPETAEVVFAAVRVSDPLHDPAAAGWRSRTDRKTAMRLLAPAVAGRWSGMERRTRFDFQVEDIGSMIVRVAPLAPPVERSDGAADLSLSVVLEAHGGVSGRFEQAQVVMLTRSGFTLEGLRRAPGTDVVTRAEMGFVRDGVRLLARTFAEGECEAVLDHEGPLPHEPDAVSLPVTEAGIPTAWPASRRADAVVVREAVRSLP